MPCGSMETCEKLEKAGFKDEGHEMDYPYVGEIYGKTIKLDGEFSVTQLKVIVQVLEKG